MQAMWYASRGAGLVTLLLFTSVMVVGALNSGRLGGARWPRFVVSSVHRNLALLAVVFLAFHVATAIIDPFVKLYWLNAIVPFSATYETVWIGLGAVAADLLLAIVISSLVRTRINLRAWKAVHFAAYLCWPVAVLHGMFAARYDTRLGWVVAVNVGCVLAVLTAVGWRIVSASRHADTVARRQANMGV